MHDDLELHPTSGFTHLEEWANSVTHGLGFGLSVAALVIAVVWASLAGSVFLIVAAAVYGATLCLLHLASTLYHSARDLKWKRRFLVLDHACIYLLIAGTYTPFALGPLRGPVGWTLFGLIWGLAILGVTRELFVRRRGGVGSSIIYLAMGWLVIGFIYPLYINLELRDFLLVLAGGLVYSLGVVFYLWRRLRFHHAIWHLFVMGGASCQFFAILGLMRV
ncbi:MAG: PAQR family membrane homeostasis protein TrhA [Opitutales bacterium]